MKKARGTYLETNTMMMQFTGGIVLALTIFEPVDW